MIGSVLDERFRVDQRLARQGALEIFEGVDIQEGQAVWVKRIGTPLDQDLDFYEGWRGQLLSVQGVESAQLPHIFSFGRTGDGALYQVESRPHGMTLRRYSAARSPATPSQSVAQLIAAAEAVGHAHSEGVAHGALSPENLYMEETMDGRLVASVGSWELGEVVIAQRSGGTALPERLTRYLAPEQLGMPVPPATPATDVYSLALILYELLTGALPTPTPEARSSAAPTPPSRFNPDIPPALERLLLRALNRDPAQRPPNGHALARALSDALAEPLPSAPPPAAPVVERTTLLVRRPGGWMPIALIAALLMICLLALLLLAREQQRASPSLTPTPAVRAVPNLVGPPFLRYNEAVQVAWNQGFVVSISSFVEDPTRPPGSVSRQCPAPGALLGAVQRDCNVPNQPPPSEDTIYVEVVQLPQPVVLRVVPDLYGQSEEEGRAALQTGGLSLGMRRSAYDLLIPAGRIVEQNPRRGLAVLPGTPIDIIVSAGPPTGEGALQPPINVDVPPSEPTALAVETAAPTTALPTETIAPPTATPSPTPQPTITVVSAPEGALLFADEFEQGNANGWDLESSSTGIGSIEEGLFFATLPEPNALWSSGPGQLFSDFTYSAQVTLLAEFGDEESSAGIIFRQQDDEHFYLFEVNGISQYRLLARNGGQWQTILDWTDELDVNLNGLANELQVQAQGERLVLSVNGTTVASGVDVPPDATYLAGDIGVAVQSGSLLVEAEFDNIEVTR